MAAAVVVLAAALCLAPPAVAGSPAAVTPDAFTITGVQVDITAETAAAARKIALADGEKRAFKMLLRRLTLRRERTRLPKLAADETSQLVKDFSVTDEKLSPVRYIATLTYRFNAPEVRRLLRDFAIQFAETPSKPVLVLPVYRAAAALALWDEPNPWRAAWSARPREIGLVPVVLPVGDLADIASIGAEQADLGDARSLTAIARRYGTSTTIVAHADLGATRKGLPLIEVAISRHGATPAARTQVASFAAAAGEGVEDVLRRAAIDIARRIEDQWKADNILRFENAAVLPITLPIGGLADWIAVKERLTRVAVINRADIVLLSRGEVRINLHYFGDVQQLTLALAQVDLALTEESGGWILKNARAAATSQNGGRG